MIKVINEKSAKDIAKDVLGSSTKPERITAYRDGDKLTQLQTKSNKYPRKLSGSQIPKNAKWVSDSKEMYGGYFILPDGTEIKGPYYLQRDGYRTKNNPIKDGNHEIFNKENK